MEPAVLKSLDEKLAKLYTEFQLFNEGGPVAAAFRELIQIVEDERKKGG